jgi:hypothetical protein
MDNASKNAGDMIGKFSLLYNRYYQVITSSNTSEPVKLSLPQNSLTSSRVQAQFSLFIKID